MVPRFFLLQLQQNLKKLFFGKIKYTSLYYKESVKVWLKSVEWLKSSSALVSDTAKDNNANMDEIQQSDPICCPARSRLYNNIVLYVYVSSVISKSRFLDLKKNIKTS